MIEESLKKKNKESKNLNEKFINKRNEELMKYEESKDSN